MDFDVLGWLRKLAVFQGIALSLPGIGLAVAPPKAVLFDVMGTCVEVIPSLVAEGEAWSKNHHIKGSWPAFAAAWVRDHVTTIAQITSGQIPWIPTDTIHRRNLKTLVQNSLAPSVPLAEQDLDEINLFWRHLKAWPDAVQGLTLIRDRYPVIAFSNAEAELLQEIADFSGLQWNALISAGEIHRYKPDAEFYLYAAQKLQLSPQQILLVAAHPYDLRAAQKLGWQTALIKRPGEYQPGDVMNAVAEFDYVTSDFKELSGQITP